MKKTEKEIENLINDSLNSDKPSHDVIFKAEQMMLSEQVNETVKKSFTPKRLIAVLSSCAVAVLVLMCCIPLFLKQQEVMIGDSDFSPSNIASIQYYNENFGTNILYPNYEVISSTLYADSDGLDVYICEVYSENGTKLFLYVLLTQTQTEIKVLNKFENLSNNVIIKEISVSYSIVKSEYCARYRYGEYEYFISSDAPTEELFLNYVREMLP